MDNKSVIRGGFAMSGWTGRFGFTGGSLSTQFPVVYNVQVGNTNDYKVDGTFDSIPPIPFTAVPANGRINPAPNQAFFVIPFRNPMPYVENHNFTYQRELGGGFNFDIGYVGNVGHQLPFNQEFERRGSGYGHERAAIPDLWAHG